MKDNRNYFEELTKRYEKYCRFPPMNHNNIAAFTLWDKDSKEAIMVTFFRAENPQVNVAKIEMGKNGPRISYHDFFITIISEKGYDFTIATLDKYIHALSL